MPQETYGQRLQQLRTAKGWSQAHFAMVSGVSIGTLRNHEQDRGVMTVSQMFTYCRALGSPCESFKNCVAGKQDRRGVKGAKSRRSRLRE